MTPVYRMVDLEKRRRDCAKAEFPSQMSSKPERRDGLVAGPDWATEQRFREDYMGESDSRDQSNYEVIADLRHPATEQITASDTNEGAKSSYMILQRTLHPSQGDVYEDTNISSAPCSDSSNIARKKSGTSAPKPQRAVITSVFLILLLVTCVGFALTFVKIFEIKSQLDSVPRASDISKLIHALGENLSHSDDQMQLISELRRNLSRVMLRRISELGANLSLANAGQVRRISELGANLSNVNAGQVRRISELGVNLSRVNAGQMRTIFELGANLSLGNAGQERRISELGANLSLLSDQYQSAADCSAVNLTLSTSLYELFQQHQHLVNTLEQLGELTNPADSCAKLSSSAPSGYYWVESSNGSAVQVYCDMTRSCGGVTGGWMRIASMDFSNSSTPCPSGLQERLGSGTHTCGIQSASASCASVSFDTDITYTKVCGKVLAYQLGTADAFGNYGRGSNDSIDSNYVDGVSLTHGSNPREHIWTFAAALDEYGYYDNGAAICECSHSGRSGGHPPEFVGQNYFCDTGITSRAYSTSDSGQLLSDSPLWDGSGCGPDSTCCTFNNPPWFYKQLPSPTSDAIEMRVCSDEERDTEDIAMSSIELFIQ